MVLSQGVDGGVDYGADGYAAVEAYALEEVGEVGRYAPHEAYASEYGVGGVEEYVAVDKGVEAVD